MATFIDITTYLTVLDDYANCYKMNTTISVVTDRKFRLWFCIIFFVTSVYDNYYCYFISL